MIKEISSESYTKFRAALGKLRLSWYAQTRQDVRAWVAMLATQQAKPTEGTERALRAVLRLLMSDGNVVLRMPSNSEALKMEKGVFDVDYHLVGYFMLHTPPLELLEEEEFRVECFQFVDSYLHLSQDTSK